MCRKGGEIKTKVNRVEIQVIRRSHPLWEVIDEMCFHSKNLYNEANYIVRQEFINNGKYINYYDMNREFKTHENYKLTMSQQANCTLRLLDKNWKSYFAGIKDWKNNKEKYLGMPKLPKYLKKDGRYIWCIPNNTCYFEGNELHFRIRKLQTVKWFTQAKGRLIQVRFVPIGTNYKMEIVTELEISDIPKGFSSELVASIDLGVDNFVTLTNNIGLQPIIINGKGIKSINQYYNKQRAKLQSDLAKRNDNHWSKKLEGITFKRNNRVKNFLHNSSKYIIDYCLLNNIDTLVCGYNKGWKQNSLMSKKVNQHFVEIPYEQFIQQLTYKCIDVGIKFITHEESYTSGTSFLDGEIPCKENYDKSRRIQRGLFQNTNSLINSDVNGSLQIMRKAFSNAISYEIEGVLNPIVINVVKFTT
ncbi:MAG: putative transposase [Anaerocolumna sp.]|jgi:putative transposase|nr:putative transposase [Anaerocolumna sp.]